MPLLVLASLKIEEVKAISLILPKSWFKPVEYRDQQTLSIGLHLRYNLSTELTLNLPKHKKALTKIVGAFLSVKLILLKQIIQTIPKFIAFSCSVSM